MFVVAIQLALIGLAWFFTLRTEAQFSGSSNAAHAEGDARPTAASGGRLDGPWFADATEPYKPTAGIDG